VLRAGGKQSGETDDGQSTHVLPSPARGADLMRSQFTPRAPLWRMRLCEEFHG
jgi:hypothetical protein